MKLQDIKKAIIDKTIEDNFLVFLCSENYFIADQYVEAIATAKNYNLQYIDSLTETESTAALIQEDAEILYVLKTEVFEEARPDYSNYNNVIVICKKIDKKLDKVVKDFVVNVPKLEEWQVVAYMQTICPGLSDQDYALFYKAAGKDIYKIDNELNKVALFNKVEQRNVMMDLLFGEGSDMYSVDTFDLVNKILENNKPKVYEILSRRKYLDLAPFAVIALLLRNYKNIVLINHKSNMSAAELKETGLSQGQINMYQRYYTGYPLDYLMNAIRFLSGLDYKLKTGLLDMSDDQLFDYIICNIMY